MKKFVPKDKLSKKARKILNQKQRKTWAINPVTRKPANPKAYNRKKAQHWKDDYSQNVELFCTYIFFSLVFY